MALVLCHSFKGGTGNTFLAAHLATGLLASEAGNGIGNDVSLLTLSTADVTALHFGLAPAQRLPLLAEPAEAAVLAGGIGLFCEPGAAFDPDFLPALQDAGFLGHSAGRTLVVDVPAGERALARRLMPHAAVHVCPLAASPDCLALLPQVLEEVETAGARHTVFVLSMVDETRRLTRHVSAFARELLGERLIGKVRADQSVPEAQAMLQPLSRYAASSAALADAQLVAKAVSAILSAERAAADAEAGASRAA